MGPSQRSRVPRARTTAVTISRRHRHRGGSSRPLCSGPRSSRSAPADPPRLAVVPAPVLDLEPAGARAVPVRQRPVLEDDPLEASVLQPVTDTVAELVNQLFGRT